CACAVLSDPAATAASSADFAAVVTAVATVSTGFPAAAASWARFLPDLRSACSCAVVTPSAEATTSSETRLPPRQPQLPPRPLSPPPCPCAPEKACPPPCPWPPCAAAGAASTPRASTVTPATIANRDPRRPCIVAPFSWRPRRRGFWQTAAVNHVRNPQRRRSTAMHRPGTDRSQARPAGWTQAATPERSAMSTAAHRVLV